MVPLVGSTVLSTKDSLPLTGLASPPVLASTVTAPCFWAASSEPRRHQLLAALVLALEVGQGGAPARHFRLGLGHAGAVAAVVQREHQLSRFHELAFLDVHFANRAGRLRTQVDRALGRHGAVGGDVDADVLALRRDDVDDGGGLRSAGTARPTLAGLPFGLRAAVHVPGASCADGDNDGNGCESILFHSGPLPPVPAALSIKSTMSKTRSMASACESVIYQDSTPAASA
jgi:hypothetical protein